MSVCVLEVNENGDEQKKGNQEKKDLGDEKTANSSLVPLSSAIIDHEIEILLSEWSKNADMLFSIHPMDGSLLVWHVDWLDEYQPGMFRQVQVLYFCISYASLFSEKCDVKITYSFSFS